MQPVRGTKAEYVKGMARAGPPWNQSWQERPRELRREMGKRAAAAQTVKRASFLTPRKDEH